MNVFSHGGRPGVSSTAVSMYRQPCWWVYRPVWRQARAGTQTVLGMYARVKFTPRPARASMLGVFRTALPLTPRASNRCWSVPINNMFGRD
jgi:hypothetical protein